MRLYFQRRQRWDIVLFLFSHAELYALCFFYNMTVKPIDSLHVSSKLLYFALIRAVYYFEIITGVLVKRNGVTTLSNVVTQSIQFPTKEGKQLVPLHYSDDTKSVLLEMATYGTVKRTIWTCV
jgi:hypothetical protein